MGSSGRAPATSRCLLFYKGRSEQTAQFYCETAGDLCAAFVGFEQPNNRPGNKLRNARDYASKRVYPAEPGGGSFARYGGQGREYEQLLFLQTVQKGNRIEFHGLRFSGAN